MNRHAPPMHASGVTAASYWKRTCRLTLLLLGVWFVGTFGVVYFARELDRISLFGWPVSFYMAAQGILLVYLAIVTIYTLRMGRAEKQFLDQTGEQAHGE